MVFIILFSLVSVVVDAIDQRFWGKMGDSVKKEVEDPFCVSDTSYVLRQVKKVKRKQYSRMRRNLTARSNLHASQQSLPYTCRIV